MTAKLYGRKIGRMLGLMALGTVMTFTAAGCGSGKTDVTDTKTIIEEALDLSNMSAQWTYSASDDAWTMSSVTAVVNPEIEEEQGVSVCVPGAYVKGIDTDGDGEADATNGSAAGNLIIDREAKITSTNGQIYTAETAPVIMNTGAAGYSEQQNQDAPATYAKEGYINVTCGNRGKQSTVEDSEGNTSYTGDAPSCLVDQKNAVRFVKYNILLGNLPGSVDYFVSTGGSGGGAHATMLAATSDNPVYFDYEAEAGAVGVYKDGDDYVTTVTVDGEEVEISDGMWGCMAYSPITTLAEADMAMAFEYNLDADYDFNTAFQKQLAQYLSTEYMDYINDQNLTADESKVGYDIDDDGKVSGTVKLSIEYDENKYKDTNGYGGTYLNMYLAEFQQSLQDYLEMLDYGTDWTWFDEDGNKMSDEDLAQMTSEDKAKTFIEGRYAKGSSAEAGKGGMDFGGRGGFPGGDGDKDFKGKGFDGNMPDKDLSEKPDGDFPEIKGNGPDGNGGNGPDGVKDGNGADGELPDMKNGGPDGNDTGGPMVGTPDAGTTQSAGSSVDSLNYSSYGEMLQAYKDDIASIEAGDEYGNNIVDLYNPLNYIGSDETAGPTWARLLMGATEGDMSMMNSLNLQIAWLAAGTDTEIEWQWDGGHVPSEILGDSLALYVDTMYGKYVDGAVQIQKQAADTQKTNGDADEATGTDISGWVSYDREKGVSFSLSDAAEYRTSGASKAIPGFDVIDYGQEDYVFGNAEKDARHWNKTLLKVLEENADTLKDLFNSGSQE